MAGYCFLLRFARNDDDRPRGATAECGLHRRPERDDCAACAAYQLEIAQPPGNVNEARDVAETRRPLTEKGGR